MAAKDYVSESRQAALQRIADDASDRFDGGADCLPSPLEQAFFYALVAGAWDAVRDYSHVLAHGFRTHFEEGAVVVRLDVPGDETYQVEGWLVVEGESGLTLNVRPQVRIGRSTVDFLLELVDHDRVARLVVECDGHDFHEKTKEQARRDKARDRAIQSAGLPVFRFAGSEIYADASKCAATCRSYLWSDLKKQEDAAIKAWRPSGPNPNAQPRSAI